VDTPAQLSTSRFIWKRAASISLSVMTDDASHAVRIAELGKYDAVANEFVTAQPYTVGVLLSSSNASSWTVHNDMDIAFRLIGAEFTSTTSTINLGSMTVSNMTDLLVTAPVDIPATSARVTFKYTRSTGEDLSFWLLISRSSLRPRLATRCKFKRSWKALRRSRPPCTLECSASRQRWTLLAPMWADSLTLLLVAQPSDHL